MCSKGAPGASTSNASEETRSLGSDKERSLEIDPLADTVRIFLTRNNPVYEPDSEGKWSVRGHLGMLAERIAKDSDVAGSGAAREGGGTGEDKKSKLET